ncbi:MAG TPA: hypothetical protein VMJ30_05255 [Gemmatimonadales bacterium]|nr:hypothetical protein [Gemmatimonadales bacterium]
MNSHPRDRDFYVGYHPVAPTGLGRRTRIVVLLLLLFAVALAVILASSQRGFAPAAFEYGHRRIVEGWIREQPYPMLVVPRPGKAGSEAESRYILAGEGKHGADDLVRGMDGRAVKLEGTMAWRDDQVMFEIAREALPPASSVLPPLPDDVDEIIGPATLVGEVIDPKCALGVMNPGTSKPHRTCAARCLSGGLPPMLLVHDSAGGSRYFFLVGREGQPLHEQLLAMAGEPVQISGVVSHRGPALYLAADPESYQRLAN